MENKPNNKIIHYIWFGGKPISELTKKCIQTWKKYLPDFEIKEWNETNFDVNQCPFVKEAYEQKKWAFVADYTRFKVLEEYGGIYLDTDMEITSDISEFLEKDLFLGVEDSELINAAVVWAKEPHNPYIKDIVNIYESKEKFNENDDLYEESVPRVLTSYFKKHGFIKGVDEIQALDNGKAYIYPMEYFYPLSYDYQNNKFTDNSVMIHHFEATWISPMEKFKTQMKRKNMKWVVYIIDFFIFIKNKCKFYINFKNISIFSIMFIVLMLAMFSFKPILSNNAFFLANQGIAKSMLQIFSISILWTYICAKVRDISLNFYSDKMNNIDSSTGEYRKLKLTLEQTLKLQKKEKIICACEILLTILVAFFPLLEIVTIVPNYVTLYVVLLAINMFAIYLGIKKNYLYRVLELVPMALIQVFLITSYPSFGIITSIISFIFVLYHLFNRKVKIKRIKSYIFSYALGVILITIFGIFGIKNLDTNTFGLNTTFNSKNIAKDLNIYKIDESITQFNAGKSVFGNNLNNFSNEFWLNQNLYIILSIILVIVMAAISKKPDFLMLLAIIISNSIGLCSMSSISQMAIVCIEFITILILSTQVIMDKILSED